MPRLKRTKIKSVSKVISLIAMEEAIARMFGIRQNIIVPNISWGIFIHECDLLIVRPSGYAIEVEIKRSKNDLLNDFKKKHNHIDVRIQKLYYAIPEDLLEICEPLIPETAGVITVHQSRGSVYAIIHREIKPNKSRRKLTDIEILKVAKLGCMRIWGLKHKLSLIKK
jgi:hypothetical protein